MRRVQICHSWNVHFVGYDLTICPSLLRRQLTVAAQNYRVMRLCLNWTSVRSIKDKRFSAQKCPIMPRNYPYFLKFYCSLLPHLITNSTLSACVRARVHALGTHARTHTNTDYQILNIFLIFNFLYIKLVLNLVVFRTTQNLNCSLYLGL